MKSECFLDTSVLLYAATGKIDEPRKFTIAYDLVNETWFGTSGQVLAEFCTNVRRRVAVPVSLAQIDGWIDQLAVHPFVPVDAQLVRAGILVAERFRISCWDGAIVAAAERLGAETLYTEDLNHGQMYGSVRVVNPFVEP